MTNQEKFDFIVQQLESSSNMSEGAKNLYLKELADLPRGKNHELTCNCETCQRMRTEPRKPYTIKVQAQLKKRLQEVGSDTVREYLEKRFG